ncbi:metal ABC transporter substrate-binding protein [Lysinibacter cavernae]|uniref:Manganese transport system substrate-binding protein n=1 Tax=Lysinibacter cavernae TaxID=1640652 RepID=A0A7X5QYR2_9MICO|nr:metal ABC transporter substrate-binding protein [Lysinibacter cavernae]NIH52469.1 manganese transport system substrate-binding protein [Lysinibacter cavernae]
MTNFSSWVFRRAGLCLAAIGVLTLVAGCAAFSDSQAPVDDQRATTSGAIDSRPLVLTTFTVLADMAKNVAGDHLRVESITKVGAEIHGYEPTPGDLTSAASASLILDNGLGLEKWFERFVKDFDVPHAVLTEGVTPIAIRGGEAEGHANPHAWMSPGDAQIYVANIADAFVALDPAHEREYRANAAAYQEQIAGVGGNLASALEALPTEQRALVTCEGAFSYLAEDAGLTEQYLWAVNAESEATPQSITAAIDFVRDNDVPAVFCESTVSSQMMRQVATEGGAEFGGVLYVDSLSEADGPVPTYLDLIRYNVDLIVQGLTSKEPSA